MTHNFYESLAASHAAEDLPLWAECYKKAFPSMVAMVNHRQDGPHQRAGIDRSIVLANSKHITIDEKVRFRNKRTGKVYDDIAIEYLSNDKTGAPGWVCKPLLCDYIAYAIAPLGKCYLLPVAQLQAAWEKHSNWILNKSGFQIIKARNITPTGQYDTVSVCMSPEYVLRLINSAMQIKFTPCEDTVLEGAQ